MSTTPPVNSPDGTTTESPKSRGLLAHAGWFAMIAGALIGVAIRAFIFTGAAGSGRSAMIGHFIYGAPLAVSAVAVYLAERESRRTWGYYARIGAIANSLFVLGTLIALIEGLICAIIIVPLFALLGAMGGLLMGALCRWFKWPRASAYSIVTLPIALAFIGPHGPAPVWLGSSERSVVIAAPAEAIWPHLMDAKQIRPAEVDRGWLYRIGVPLPDAGVTSQRDATLVRSVTMGKAIHFEQVATDWQVNDHVHWTYRFAPDSFPRGALDDHVEIGGHYFDVTDTRYTLKPEGEDRTRLTIRMGYRVSTDFNWYANGVAKLLIGNFEEVILDFYRVRAEGVAVSASQKAL